MSRTDLILDRYEPLGTAGEGGFGTVQVAWDPRIQRKVAIKTIKLTAVDAARAALPGARAVANADTASRWHGVQPWNEYLAEQGQREARGALDAEALEPVGYGDSWQEPTRFETGPYGEFSRSGETYWADELDGSEGPYELDEREGALADGGLIGGQGLSDRSQSRTSAPRDGDGGAGMTAGGHGVAAGEENDFDEDELDSSRVQVTSLAHLPGLDEARTAAMLSDPRIVTVYDFEVRGRYAYLIMEYVEGITLTKLLASYADWLTLDMVAAVFDAVAGALSTAHAAGVLHLDIKPDNIMLNAQGQVKVTDFGLATLADASGMGTTGGGTIGYMPLEQMRRGRLDARTDEWSLASVAYEMLTGSNPFRVPGLDAAEAAIEDAELVLPSLCWDDLDEQIDDVIFYALDPDQDERYDTVEDFAEEMDKFLGDADEGAAELAEVVGDALGLFDEEEPVEESEWDAEYGAWDNVAGRRSKGIRARMFDKMKEYVAAGDDQDGDEDASYGAEVDYYDDGQVTRQRRLSRFALSSGARTPLTERVPHGMVSLAARVLAAASSGFLAFFALSNMQVLSSGFGGGTPYVVGIVALVVAVLGALWGHVGAIVAFVLFGTALALEGSPIMAAVVLVAAIGWWYTVGHQGKAAANVALSLPVLGAVGGASAVPLLAGASLKPVQAVLTTAFSFIVAFALASLGTGSLLGWDAPANWEFSRLAGTSLVAMLTTLSTWATLAGWIGSAAVLSACCAHNKKWLHIVGVLAAAAILLAGSLVFAPPTPQLIVSVLITTVVLLVVH